MPWIDKNKCINCGICVKECPVNAILMKKGKTEIDMEKCISCGLCAKICPNRAIEMVEVSKEYKNKYPKTYPKIDLGKCCFCGLCEDICSKDAIRLTKNFFLSTFDDSNVIRPPMPKAEEQIND